MYIYVLWDAIFQASDGLYLTSKYKLWVWKQTHLQNKTLRMLVFNSVHYGKFKNSRCMQL